MSRSLRLLVVAFVVLSTLTLMQGYFNGRDDDRRASESEERAAELSERLEVEQAEKDLLARRIDESTTQTGELIAQVEALGKDPVVDQSEVPPSVLPPASSVSAVDVAIAVEDYFQRYPVRVPGVPRSAVQGAVAEYLVENPPPAGRAPTDREIASSVADYLRANPPPAGDDGSNGTDGTNGTNGTDGKDGKDGRSTTDVRLEGCELVFVFSDGTTERLGPVCGPVGPAGPPGADGKDSTVPGPAGPPGVVTVTQVGCAFEEGLFLTSMIPSYDAATQTLTYTCTKGDPPGGGPIEMP